MYTVHAGKGRFTVSHKLLIELLYQMMIQEWVFSLFEMFYIFVIVGPYMFVCVYDICVADCNQEPVEAVVAQVVSQYNGLLIS